LAPVHDADNRLQVVDEALNDKKENAVNVGTSDACTGIDEGLESIDRDKEVVAL